MVSGACAISELYRSREGYYAYRNTIGNTFVIEICTAHDAVLAPLSEPIENSRKLRGFLVRQASGGTSRFRRKRVWPRGISIFFGSGSFTMPRGPARRFCRRTLQSSSKGGSEAVWRLGPESSVRHPPLNAALFQRARTTGSIESSI